MQPALFELLIDETKSLILPHPDCAEEIFKLIDDDRLHLREWLPWVDATRDVSDTRDNLENRISGFEDKTQASFYGIHNGAIVASVGFIYLKDRSGEIGYWLLSEHQGQGLITTYVKACIEYGFSELGLERIIIQCDERNVKSAAVPLRLGFFKSSEPKYPDESDNESRTLVFTLCKEGYI